MSKVYLLDTNTISELSRTKPSPEVAASIKRNFHMCAISSTVLQELHYGIKRLPEGQRKSSLELWLQQIESMIEIIPYDGFAASICAELLARAEKAGVPRPHNDTQIAATALANGMVLVTRNVEDYKPLTEFSLLHVENWFSK